jgi:iron complex outermembrane receptor protein
VSKTTYGNVRAAVLFGSAALSTLAAVNTAAAQQMADPSVGEIVVTAQRREERLQDVPISVSAISPLSLKTSGVQGLRALNIAVPALTVSQTPAGIVANYIRGIGSTSANVGDEPSVALYLDGFYLPTANMAVFGLGGIERVEVLKGPQGTLFGRNASGGVIQVVTRDPSFTPSGNANLSYQSYDTVSASAYLTGRINSVLAADLSAEYRDQGQGWGRDLTTGAEVNKTRYKSLRAKLLFQPTDALKSTLAFDSLDYKSDVGVSRSGLPGALLPLNVPVAGSIYDTQQNGPAFNIARQWGLQSKTQYEAGPLTFTNLAQYRSYRQKFQTDADYGPIDLVDINWHRKDDLVTEELQAASTGDSRLQWIAGLFYMDYTSQYEDFYQRGRALSGRVVGNFPRQRTHSYAAFGQATYKLRDDTALTLGYRYTWERKDYRFGVNLNGGPQSISQAVLDQSRPTWRMSLDHHFTDQVMSYLSYNRGYKSGGFNTSTPANAQTPVHPEVVDAYEIGTKAEFFERRLTANIALFYNDFRDLQVQTLQAASTGGLAAILTNAANSKIKGVDAEFKLKATSHLTLNAAANYLHAKYVNFHNVPFTSPNANGTNRTRLGDASGADLIRAPTVTTTFGADYTLDLPTGALVASGAVYYNSGFVFEPDQRLRQPHYTLLNASLAYRPDGTRWDLRVFATNIANTKYFVSQQSSAFGDSAAPGEPRIVGVAVGYKF